MTDTNETQDLNAQQPTTPLPAAHGAPPTAPPYPPAQPPIASEPPPPAHGVHAAHQVSNAAIAAMILGAVFFALLAFGVGWSARGAALRFQAVHGGYGQSQGYGVPGGPGMRGYGGQGQQPGGRGYGRGRRGMMGGQSQLPEGHPGLQGQPTTVTPNGFYQ